MPRRGERVRAAVAIAMDAIAPECVLGLPFAADAEIEQFLETLADCSGADAPPGCLPLTVTKYLVRASPWPMAAYS